MNLIGQLHKRFPGLAIAEIFRASSHHSRSQLYKWCQGVEERPQRPTKVLPEEVVVQATEVITMFPHFGGTKGQAYMLYHQLGLIGLKSLVRRKMMV